MPRLTHDKEKKKNRASAPEEISRGMESHIQSLGFTTAADYKAWCDQNGFLRNLSKNSQQMRQERDYLASRKAQAVLEARKTFKRPKDAVISYLEDTVVGKKTDDNILPRECKGLCEAIRNFGCNTHHRDNFAALVKVLLPKTKALFEPLANIGQPGETSFLKALASIAYWKAFWLRSPEDWKPKSHNVKRQYASLLRHLFANYEVPSFLDRLWYNHHNQDGELAKWQRWFIHLGGGKNLRTAEGLPTPITKKAAHYFCQAPDDCTPYEAIRYGQILAIDGTPRLAQALRGTRVIGDWQHEEFWQSVFRWFVDNPMLDLVHVGPILDWLYNQRFEWRFHADGPVGGTPPPQPNLSMKKRDPESTLKAVEAWHKQLGRETAKDNSQSWPASGFKTMQFEEGVEGRQSHRIWFVEELLTTKALQTEGREMHHCVGSYSSSCISGRCSIFSLRCTDKDGTRRVATIEVNKASKMIVQARTKRNEATTAQHKNIIQRWATHAGLGVGTYMWGRAW